MAVFSKLVSLASDIIWRWRYPWVEVSLARAWGRDVPPRLFDRGKT
jgi:hypothetical protein